MRTATPTAQAILPPKFPKCVRKMSDDRQHAPATLRNRDFILDSLRDVLPTTGVILEIASGSGEHIVHFAKNFPALVFQPSDPEADARLSVAAWVKATRVTNVRAPITLDASHSVWPIASADGIICINVVHISPWEATLGLIKGDVGAVVQRLLKPEGSLASVEGVARPAEAIGVGVALPPEGCPSSPRL
jgi:tRNA G46 methylase TrmB